MIFWDQLIIKIQFPTKLTSLNNAVSQIARNRIHEASYKMYVSFAFVLEFYIEESYSTYLDKFEIRYLKIRTEFVKHCFQM